MLTAQILSTDLHYFILYSVVEKQEYCQQLLTTVCLLRGDENTQIYLNKNYKVRL